MKITFKNETEIKIVSQQGNVKGLITNRSSLKERLKEVLLIEGKLHQTVANLVLCKGMKSTIGGKYVDKYKNENIPN